MKTTAALALALLSTACGAQEPTLPQAQDDAPRNTRQMPIPSESAAPGSAWSLKAASPDKLPECTPDTEGRLAWVPLEPMPIFASGAELPYKPIINEEAKWARLRQSVARLEENTTL